MVSHGSDVTPGQGAGCGLPAQARPRTAPHGPHQRPTAPHAGPAAPGIPHACPCRGSLDVEALSTLQTAWILRPLLWPALPLGPDRMGTSSSGGLWGTLPGRTPAGDLDRGAPACLLALCWVGWVHKNQLELSGRQRHQLSQPASGRVVWRASASLSLSSLIRKMGTRALRPRTLQQGV